ncbi:hypothetical protein CNYM01_13663 [Colletotrichum nymphaeae SA-01]|uniref:Uncharacterized protein n=1 Tax=Colletotrichum nymphaeae SA-01 TaxID=1460502 RepID=A0A135RY16_9PEZI|nr:hypothetical protein CNYM01_13663 [Colletotrichum nymphaeae SA-01]
MACLASTEHSQAVPAHYLDSHHLSEHTIPKQPLLKTSADPRFKTASASGLTLQFGNGPFETVAGHTAGSWPAFFFFLSKKESGDRTSSFGSRNTARRTFGQESENLALNAGSKQPIATLSFACQNCLGQWPNSANSILVDGTAPDSINSPAIKSLFQCLLSN